MKTHELCKTIVPFNLNIKVFSYLSGAFPHKSSRVNVYVMVMYDYDSNAIMAEPIKNRQAATICYTFLKIHKVLKARVSNPKVYIMDNECSSDLKEAIKSIK